MSWDGSEIAAQVAVSPVTDDALCGRVTGHYPAPPTPPRARRLRATLVKFVKERGLVGIYAQTPWTRRRRSTVADFTARGLDEMVDVWRRPPS